MHDDVFPWRGAKDLADVLAALKPVLAALNVVAPGGGCTEQEIAAAEARAARPFPEDVRALYRAMRPTELFSGDARKEFGFYTIGSNDLAWRPMDAAEPAEDWAGAAGLALGQSASGDPFWWVEGHRTLPPGGVVLLDHEGGLGEASFVYFARSLPEFLSKLAHFRGLYPPAPDDLFQREYFELNPTTR
jgi:hypothetical protein